MSTKRNTTRQIEHYQTHHLPSVEVVLEEHRDSRGLDGDAAVLLILAGVSKARLTRVLGGDDACLRYQGIGKGRLAVVHVRDHGHVAYVVLLVHDLTELVRREVNLFHPGEREGAREAQHGKHSKGARARRERKAIMVLY